LLEGNVSMSFVDLSIRVLLVLQIIAGTFFCLFSLYCYLMVWIHARHKKAMLARDEAVWTAWNPPHDDLPFVTIQLPLYNERYVVGRLIDTIVQLDYPKDRMEIHILDDSTDETTQIARDMAERHRRDGFDIRVLHRTDRTGFKAGALAEGNKTARGEFIAIFDADFVPGRDFLRKTLPFFQDPKLALVQTLWGHLNADYSPMTRAQAVGLDGLNYVIQSAQCWSGLMMHFQGTAGVWRRTAIDDSGGWQSDTLTEDLDLSYRSQIRGWKQKYLPQVLCPGELPATISAAKTQQHRWAKGGFQVMVKLFPGIMRSNIPWYAKFEAGFYMISMILQPCLLIISVSWPAQLWLRQGGNLPPMFFPIATFVTLCSFGPPLLFLYAQSNLHRDWLRRLHHYAYLMFWSMGVAITNSRAIIEVAFNVKTGFVRTPKFRIEGRADSFVGKAYKAKFSGQVLVEAVIAAWCLAGLSFMLLRREPIFDPFLLTFTIGLCLTTTQAVLEPIRQMRAARKALA
jgi:cellulose synthase/poly-beta-1,6-N-acetylglucosamine synthase-like glycosyltransferase